MALFKKKETKKDDSAVFNTKWEPLIYLVPFAVGLLIFTVYPIINVVFMSFKQGYRLSGTFNGWGLQNYQKVVSDPLFHNAIKTTFAYVFTVVPIATVLSVIIAVLLNQKIKFIGAFQFAYFLPMVTSAIAVGLVWKYMFNYEIGIINFFLNLFKLPKINWLGATGGQAPYNIWVIIIFGIWNMIPFTTILLLSGLQNIDPLYYTAAKVDGADSFTIFRRITIPLLAPTIFLTMIVNMISSFKVYNDIIPFWQGDAGVTGRNLYTFVYYIKQAFYNNQKLGVAAAASILLFALIFVFTMLQKCVQKKFAD